YPRNITTQSRVPNRTGKIFLDFNINARRKTLNVAHSPRGRPAAPACIPLTRDGLARPRPHDLLMRNGRQRAADTRDRWRDVLARKHGLERALAGAREWQGGGRLCKQE